MATPLPFDDDMFPSTAIILPVGYQPGPQGGIVNTQAGNPGAAWPCYVEPEATLATREEDPTQPLVRSIKRFRLFGPTNPNVVTDQLIQVDGMTLSAMDQSLPENAAILWQVSAQRVS